jgi:hypothetical protein
MSAWLQTTLGVVLGFAASYTFWWYLGTRVVPRIDFSDDLHSAEEGGGPRYWVVVCNQSRRRGVLEPRFLATFRVLLPGKELDSIWDVPVSNTKILRLAPGDERLLFLDPAGMSSFVREQIRLYGPDDVDVDTLSIEDLFGLGSDGRLTIEAIGFDERSSTRKYLQSRVYRADDVDRQKR